ncbi:MAG: NADH-quinone oxidoreductase subunit F [Planctomycetota bacterium]|nr:MAG: NADH-quinone oxidoreductase subunit F [Planctomycetota bacterium]
MTPDLLESKIAECAASLQQQRLRLLCCASTGCLSSGSGGIAEVLTKEVQMAGLAEQVAVVPTGCMGLCSLGPLVRVTDNTGGEYLLQQVDEALALRLVSEYVIPTCAGETMDLAAIMPEALLDLQHPFFARQVRVVLAKSGYINPENIDEYFARGGYRSLAKALVMGSEQVIELIKASGLRGRGGAGFPTGLKWQFTRQAFAKAGADEAYIICNGDEGDPGAYMDRSILEGDPHAVIEGMAIAALATGATKGIFYIRAEYPLAVERVEKAIMAARRAKVIGPKVLGTDFAFTCEVRLGAGAFVCGEETALIASIEGLRGTPRPRPPFPSVKGLWGKPTTINNVETLANIAPIMQRGAEWFAAMGTDKSKGTKVFALTGKIKHSGLIEVPMGMTLREIVEDIGGGVDTGKPVKAVQTGGPSGGMIPASAFDSPVSYEHLQELGSIMGSGGMIVLDEDDDVLSLACFYLEFCVEESCGKCAPCRVGGSQLLVVLKRIKAGDGKPEDIALIRRLATAMQKASLCGLGQTAPNPVLSVLRYFSDELTRHLADYACAGSTP